MKTHFFKVDRVVWWLMPLGLFILLSGCSYLFPDARDKKFTPKDLNLPEVEFKADLEVVGDDRFIDYFKSTSSLLDKDERPPTSTNALRYRAAQDLKVLKKALKNKGYFEGEVEYVIDVKGEVKQVKLIVKTGPRYRIGAVVVTVDNDEDPQPIAMEKFKRIIGIEAGSKVELDKAIESVARLEKYFHSHGYPQVQIPEPIGQLDPETKTLELQFAVSLHGKKNFGQLQIKGIQGISESYVKNRLHWSVGEVYDVRELEKGRRNLLDSEIFSSVLITPEATGEKGVPIKVEVLEGPPRAVGAGVRYATQEGFGGKLYWEHRNVFGGGEHFVAKAEGSQKQMKATLSFEKPDFFYPDFNLYTKLEYTRADTRAYNGNIYNAFLGVKHRYSEYLIYALGGEVEHSDLFREGHIHRSLGGFPLNIFYDRSNDPINPYKGWRAKIDFTPYVFGLGDKGPMFRTVLFGSYYLRLIKKDKLVIGLWGRLGRLDGTPYGFIPVNRLFFAGGVNSVRGYGFQRLNTLDSRGVPIGGRSLMELGAEPRWRITEKIGACVFVEGGSTSTQAWPTLSKPNFRIGYGFGVKYYTDIGPFRVDLAFPTNRRKLPNGKHYDSPVQFYISVGQAF